MVPDGFALSEGSIHKEYVLTDPGLVEMGPGEIGRMLLPQLGPPSWVQGSFPSASIDGASGAFPCPHVHKQVLPVPFSVPAYCGWSLEPQARVTHTVFPFIT